MIRAGYRGWETGGFAEDYKFKENIEGAKRADNLDVETRTAVCKTFCVNDIICM